MSRIWPCALLACLVALIAPATSLGARSNDRNRNQIPDKWEKANRVPTSSNQVKKDSDGDGLNMLAEYQSKTNPRKEDSDGDGVADSDEDRDRDKVDNGNEVRERTRPDKRDSNGNGRPDGKEDADRDGLNNAGEDASGNDPIKRDTDDDGVKDGDENAGHVSSFVDGVLTIRTFGGKDVRGRVTDDTEIYCDTDYGYEFGDDEDSGEEDDEGAEEAFASRPAPDEFEELPESELEGSDCSPDNLEPGAAVHEALIEPGPGGPSFSAVDLVLEDDE